MRAHLLIASVDKKTRDGGVNWVAEQEAEMYKFMEATVHKSPSQACFENGQNPGLVIMYLWLGRSCRQEQSLLLPTPDFLQLWEL